MFDDDEYDLYRWMLDYVVPRTTGMWGQPMFCLKITHCEDVQGDKCSCMYANYDYQSGGVFSKMMEVPDEVVDKAKWR